MTTRLQYRTLRLSFLRAMLVLAVLVAVVRSGDEGSARAQTAATDLSEIQHDVHGTYYFAGKTNKRTGEIRILLYVANLLIVAGIGVAAYLIVIQGGGIRKFATNAALTRLLKRQARLATAIYQLKEFAGQSKAENDDLIALLATIGEQMKQLDKDLQERASRPT